MHLPWAFKGEESTLLMLLRLHVRPGNVRTLLRLMVDPAVLAAVRRSTPASKVSCTPPSISVRFEQVALLIFLGASAGYYVALSIRINCKIFASAPSAPVVLPTKTSAGITSAGSLPAHRLQRLNAVLRYNAIFLMDAFHAERMFPQRPQL